jgi:hypothetical protein
VQLETSLQTISNNIYTTASLRVDSTNTGTFKKKEVTTQFLPGTPIVSVTLFDHPILFQVFPWWKRMLKKYLVNQYSDKMLPQVG